MSDVGAMSVGAAVRGGGLHAHGPTPAHHGQPPAPGPPPAVDEFARYFMQAADQVSTVLRGKLDEVKLALVCLFSGGHLLVEDVPGVGKTTLAKALASTLGLSWHRAQFTPDLLPSDITGSSIFDRSSNEFSFRPGAVFANVLLADEINRASPKTQAALLEAMEELQVTVDARSYPLPEPFMVVATQNPVEHDGTYPLPVSELDRFLVRARLGYPDLASEVVMLQDDGLGPRAEDLPGLTTPERLRQMMAMPSSVYVAPALQTYMVQLAQATRAHPLVSMGLSPRSLKGLQKAARVLAAANGRDFVTPDDIKALVRPVGEHRLVLLPEAAYSNATPGVVLAQVLASVPVPVPGATSHRLAWGT